MTFPNGLKITFDREKINYYHSVISHFGCEKKLAKNILRPMSLLFLLTVLTLLLPFFLCSLNAGGERLGEI